MAAFSIVVDDDDREQEDIDGQPWTANVYHGDQGRDGEPLAVAFGTTARAAVADLVASRLNDWED